jgi:WD40 repeat protein
MGVVYKAWQLRLNRPVAIKMVLAGAHAAAADLQRFRTEAEAIARLQHPNIVQIHEVGDHHGLPYFSLEFCAGGSLADRLDGTPQPPRTAAELVEILARAAEAAHAKGVVHRDLKPGNILFAEDGTPKLTDFGLAKKLDEAGNTASGAVMGTPSYMAPEQAGGKTKEVGPAADVYALGAVLYELLTGRPPFKAATQLDTLLQVVAEQPVSPRRLNPQVPRDLETICLKCLAKVPARRYASAADLADDLRRYLEGRPIQAQPVGNLERFGRWCRRNPALAALTAAVAALLLGVAVLATVAAVRIDAEATEAKRQAAEAERQAAEARRLAEEAERARRRAAGLAEDERRALGEADRAQKKARVELARAEANVYFSRIALAERYWLANDVRLADRKLAECPPDLHHWEWHYMKRLCHAELRSVKGPAFQSGWGAAISPDGRQVASFGTTTDWGFGGPFQRRTWGVTVWDAAKGRTVHALLPVDAGRSELRAIAFSRDGQFLAAAVQDGSAVLWRMDINPPAPRALRQDAGPCLAVAFSPDGRFLATGSGRGTVKVWDVALDKEVLTLPAHAPRGVNAVAFSADGKFLATASSDETAQVWDFAAIMGKTQAPPWKSLVLMGHQGAVIHIAFSPNGKRLASASADGTAKVWELNTGKSIHTLAGHSRPVLRVAFGGDGSRIVTAGADQTVRCWEADTGKEVFTLRGHGGPVLAVAFRADGKELASVSADREVRGARMTLKVWDGSTGRQRLRLPAGPVGPAFSPDGRLVAFAAPVTLNTAGAITVWDMAAGRPLQTLRGHRGDVLRLVFSPDGRHLLSAGTYRDRAGKGLEVRRWEIATGQGKLLLTDEGDHPCVAFSPAGRHVVTAAADEGKVLKLWSATTGKLLGTRVQAGPVRCLAFVASGHSLAAAISAAPAQLTLIQVWEGPRVDVPVFSWSGAVGDVEVLAFAARGPGREETLLAAGGSDRAIRVWDLAVLGGEASAGSAPPLHTLLGHTQTIRGLVFSDDGKRLASASADDERRLGEIMLWDLRTGQEVLTIDRPAGELAFHFSPRAWQLAAAGMDGTLSVWDGTPGRELLVLPDAGQGVAWGGPKGERLLAVFGPGQSIKLLDASSGRELRTLGGRDGHGGKVLRAVFSPDGSRLATASEDRTVKLWDVATGEVVRTLRGHGDTVFAVAFSPDGSTLASASGDETVRLWDARTGELRRTFRGHGDRVLCVAFSPDGRHVASGGEDEKILVWDAKTGQVIHHAEAGGQFVNAVVFSPDRRHLAWAGDGKVVTLWDLKADKVVGTLRGHVDSVRDLAYSPNGKQLASAGWDRRVIVWDVAARKELFPLAGHDEGVTALVFAPDGGRLASAGADLSVRLWDVRP